MRYCIFCGSAPGNNPEFLDAALATGAALAARGIGIVYGGGNVGLMGAVADSALAAGGEVIGVIPGGLVRREVAHRGLTRLDVVDTMHERKTRMHELSDGFLILPGGFGTLDELFETLTWAQLGIHQKPTGLLSVAGYFAPLISFLDGAVSGGLLKSEHRQLLLDHSDLHPLLDAMSAWKPPVDVIERWDPSKT
jgi:uncharacterized protein (TIGR00730 family)